MNTQVTNSDAEAIYRAGMRRVKTSPEPVGQKYPIGTRVKIDDHLDPSMAHFPAGKNATVCYTYAHAFGGTNVKDYCLDVDGVGKVSWYCEEQLTAIPK